MASMTASFCIYRRILPLKVLFLRSDVSFFFILSVFYGVVVFSAIFTAILIAFFTRTLR